MKNRFSDARALRPGAVHGPQRSVGSTYNLFLLCGLMAAGPAVAGERELSLNGFGGWAYGDTDGNRYLTGSEGGEAENVDFCLAVSATPTERLRISGQFGFVSDPKRSEDVETDLDYAFAEWSFSDQLRGRIGRSKHPFGIYAEIFNVGTLRPFYNLPQGIYGPTGIAGESYDGVGITGYQRFADSWDLEYDVYVGTMRFDAFEPWDGLRDEEDDEPGDDEDEELFESKERDEVVGFRLGLATPVEGLSFGFSAYSGSAEDDEGLDGGEIGEVGEDKRHTGYGIHIEYSIGSWTVRAEAARIDEEDELKTDAAYVELAYMLDDRWQLTGRYDHSDTDVEEVDLGNLPSLAEHDDLAFGVNYWFSPELALKLAVHRLEGNRLALPEEVDEAVDTGEFDEETTLISFGAQFSF